MSNTTNAQGAAAPADTHVTWSVEVITHVSDFAPSNIVLQLTVINVEGIQIQFSLESTPQPETAKRGGGDIVKKDLPGRNDSFLIHLPADFEPAAVWVLDKNDLGDAMYQAGGDYSRLYLQAITLNPANSSSSSSDLVCFTANTYISMQQGNRQFVRDDAFSNPRLAGNGVLAALMEDELKELRGEGKNASQAGNPRKDPDRIYRYTTYNDLGGNIPETPGKTPGNIRKPLGGSSERPYPRRIATNRGNYDGIDCEVAPVMADGALVTPGVICVTVASIAERLPQPLKGLILGGGVPVGLRAVATPWVPQDDNFDVDKTRGFIGNADPAERHCALKIIYFALHCKPLLARRILQASRFDSVGQGWLGLYDEERLDMLTEAAAMSVDVLEGSSSAVGAQLAGSIAGRVNPRIGKQDTPDDSDLKYDVPRSFENRLSTWSTDEAMGRMFLAGQNPLTIEVLGLERLQVLLQDSAGIREVETSIKSKLEGKSMQAWAAAAEAGDEPRLFIVDYWAVYDLLDELEAVNAQAADRVMHAGRCVLFRRSDGHLVPIAIELAHSKKQPSATYTSDDPPAVWQVAKIIFQSVDSAWHQLISNWLRTHACVEPYLLATRRRLPAAHPMFRLLMPHFRYTLAINAAARALLVNAGGVFEKSLCPGPFSMQLSSTVYGRTWRFKDEGLRGDLNKRGFLDAAGGLRVQDYPFAEDGLLIWDALHKYFTDYVQLYYDCDAAVAADTWLQEWWNEVKTEAHPEAPADGWVELDGRDNLVLAVCTIAWVASGHHAAVNFGQYDYSGWMPSHSLLCRRPAPAKGSDAWQELSQQNINSKKMISYITRPATAATVMTMVKLLSSQFQDEQYLSTDAQRWLPLDDGDVLRIFQSLDLELQNIILDLATFSAGDVEGSKPLWRCLCGEQAEQWLHELKQSGMLEGTALVKLAHSILDNPASQHYGSRLWVDGHLLVGAQQGRPVLVAQLGSAGSQHEQQLQRIDFSQTQALCISPEQLPKQLTRRDLPQLLFLDVSGCGLGAMPEALGKLQALQMLRLSGCEDLAALPDSITQLSALHYLHVDGCSKLQELPELFGQLVRLQHLVLTGRSSVQLESEAWKMVVGRQQLEPSQCSGIQRLPKSFGQLVALQHLDLSQCSSIQQLPESFGQLVALQHLDLSSCSSIQQLPESFGQLVALQFLLLNGCSSIQQLPESFGQLAALQHLDFSRCSSILQLPESFGQLAALQHLDLSQCSRLQALPGSFGQLAALQHLDIGGCSRLAVLPGLLSGYGKTSVAGTCVPSLEKRHVLATVPTVIAELRSLRTLILSSSTRRGSHERSTLIDKQLESLQHLPAAAAAAVRSVCGYMVHSDGTAHQLLSLLVNLAATWAAAAMTSAELSDICWVLWNTGLAQLPDWAEQWKQCASLLEQGDVRKALICTTDALAQLHQQLCSGGIDGTGLQDLVGRTMTWHRSSDIKELALRLYRNLASEDEHMVLAGVTELELLLVELLSSVTAMQAAFSQLQKLQQQYSDSPSSPAVKRGPGPVAEAREFAAWEVQEVFFVTDRQYNAAAHRAGQLPDAFGTAQHDGVRYGVATVRIPKMHRPGYSLPAQALTAVELLDDRECFMTKLRNSLGQAGSGRELVLFIHGYNVGFKGAVTSAAQLTCDTSPGDFKRTALAFDWASCHHLFGYLADLERSEKASSKLLDMLGGLSTRLGPPNQVCCAIHITAHSMGNRVLQRALSSLHIPRPEDRQVRNQAVRDALLGLGGMAGGSGRTWSVTFAAPDAPRFKFKELLGILGTLAANAVHSHLLGPCPQPERWLKRFAGFVNGAVQRLLCSGGVAMLSTPPTQQSAPTAALVSSTDHAAVATAPKLTLYCSRLDWALWFSNLRLDDHEGRAGIYMWGPMSVLRDHHKFHVFMDKGLDTVTVFGTPPRDWLGHGYFRSSEQLLDDISSIMAGKNPRTGDTLMSPDMGSCGDCLTCASSCLPQPPPRAIDMGQ